MALRVRLPLAAGGALALASALAFGATTPLLQRFGRGVGPFTTASLLYAGASLLSIRVSVKASSRQTQPAPSRHLSVSDLPRVAAVALLGAVAAPVALAWGLQRTDGVTASLLLNLEAVFTVALAYVLWSEPIGPRVGAALVAMIAGGAILVAGGSAAGIGSRAGVLAVVLATLAWAADNAFGRPLADRDPRQVVLAKAALGAAASVALALASHEALPAWRAALGLAACGGVGYGISLRLYLRAQRDIGAARTGSIFACAPFVGAALAWGMGQRLDEASTLVSGGLCGLGVWLHLTEKHSHRHDHGPMDHSHAHTHDDPHHSHSHDEPSVASPASHSHRHTHEPMTHAHPHALDEHHRHH